MKKSEYAQISSKAQSEGIGFAYRDKCQNKDSGWRFFSSPGDYAEENPLERIKKRELVNRFPEVEEILFAGRGSIYKLQPKGWKKVSRDNSLSYLDTLTFSGE